MSKKMTYEGGSQSNPEFCVWRDDEGKEVFRMKYSDVLKQKPPVNAPPEVEKEIIFWQKMLQDPD